jgi:Putative peptidoglycan binding domain
LDHARRAPSVDKQLGTVVTLKMLASMDSTIGFNSPRDAPQKDDHIAHGILWVQQSLNKLGANPQLEEDGINGPKTMAMVRRFQRENDLEVDGLAGPETIGEIGEHLGAVATSPLSKKSLNQWLGVEIPCEIEQGISGRASGKVFWQTMEIGADTGAQSAEVRVSIAGNLEGAQEPVC